MNTETHIPAIDKRHDITAFASVDKTRYVLNSVYYDSEENVMVATDGRRLMTVPVDGTELAELPESANSALEPLSRSAIIPSAVIKRGINNIPKLSNLPILNSCFLKQNGDETKIVLSTNDMDNENDLAAKTIEGQYPNYKHVIPNTKPTVMVALNPELLKTFCEYATKHAVRAKDTPAIKIELTDALSPIKLRINVGSEREAIGVLMPVRIEGPPEPQLVDEHRELEFNYVEMKAALMRFLQDEMDQAALKEWAVENKLFDGEQREEEPTEESLAEETRVSESQAETD